MKVWWYLVQIIRATALPFAAATVAGGAYFGFPIVLGLATRAFFDALSERAPAGPNVWTVLALLLLLQLARSGVLGGFDLTWANLRYAGMALLRENLLRQLLRRPGALPLPDSPGEAISRFRDDAHAVMNDAIDGWVDLIGRTIFALAAFAVMARIDLPLTVAVVVMLALSVPIIVLAGDRIATYRRLNHEAIGRVTGFLAEVFGGAQSIKAAGATGHVVRHFEQLGERRRRAAVRDQIWEAVETAVTANVVTFGTGVVLLVAGQAMRAGTFTVGDFSLFVVYLTDLMWFPAEIARWFTSYRQAEVSLGRMAHLLGGGDPRTLVARGAATGKAPSVESAAIPPDRPALATPAPLLEARGLTYRHPASGRGIQDVSLRIEEGSLVVITGRVAAGKTTLLQALLGLLPGDAGAIFWKGAPVADPASFFGPPRTSYLPQAPRLFSETLRANVQEGWAADNARLARVARRAVFERDLAALPDGWDTPVGTRGARLSGGQIQRVAAARAFLRAPDLLVLDDLSSALDPPTEALLWERLAEWRREAPNLTILAVSHRPTALQRADRILRLEDGRVVESGRE
ncbi:MAG: ATP-binding cassette domain-containing protein [Chloroflexota bacterium]